jgi:SulP family sulfate permease
MNFTVNQWLPKSILLLRDYDRHKFLSDLIAGVTVGLVALPLAMAFAIASGVSPQAGIYCAIVTGFLISALGGSKTQIGGPTGAFVVVISGIIAKHGIDGLFECTMMAGVLLVLLGITGMGTAVKYFPRQSSSVSQTASPSSSPALRFATSLDSAWATFPATSSIA